MSKNITISVSNWVYEAYIQNFPGKNRSEWIEELIVKGAEAISESYASDKQKILHLAKQVHILKDENAKNLRTIGTLKHKLEKKRVPKSQTKMSKYTDWDAYRVVDVELKYWIEHPKILAKHLHGQRKTYNQECGLNVSLEEFKRRHEEMGKRFAS